MIFTASDYNPFPSIKANSERGGGRSCYNAAFYDFVKKELFLGGIAPETKEEFDEILVLLFNMDII
jgi:hypothetical protein